VAKRKIEDIARVAAAALDTPSGQKLMDHLLRVFYNKQVYAPKMDPLEMVFHDGKRYMVNYLQTLVEQGRDSNKAPKKAVTDEEDSPDA
jgi:hypothetical protein